MEKKYTQTKTPQVLSAEKPSFSFTAMPKWEHILIEYFVEEFVGFVFDSDKSKEWMSMNLNATMIDGRNDRQSPTGDIEKFLRSKFGGNDPTNQLNTKINFD